MTTLATHPLNPDQLNLLDTITAVETPLGSLRFDDFKAACIEDGNRHEGWVNPNRVSAILHDRFGEINPRSLSAWWASGCSRGKGFMDKSTVEVPIDPTHSKGNGNKSLPMRKLRAVAEVAA